jgi:FMN phosphatase YigB (HAD superfamily)
MGGVASTYKLSNSAYQKRRIVPVFVVSLDALGTLYRFREPVAVQYLQVARSWGLSPATKIEPQDLEKSFRTTFKHYNRTYPNYGKHKLNDPQEWWIRVINDTFVKATGLQESALPSNLGLELYKHFALRSAYELYPDSISFLKSMKAIKEQYSDPDGPIICVGVVTNSDPRVAGVLDSLRLRVGPSEHVASPLRHIMRQPMKMGADGSVAYPRSPWFDAYDSGNDIDFVATSYDAGAEKPDGGIWAYAEGFIQDIAPARAEKALAMAQQAHPSTSNSLNRERPSEDVIKGLIERIRLVQGEVSWIHIGDEIKKDYKGAQRFGHQALHLEREDKPADEGIHTISSLEEAAMIVNVMAQEHFKANPAANVMDS